MRTLSSLLGRNVVTHSGATLGRVHDLRGTLTSTTFEVTALCVGRTAWLDRLGIYTRCPHQHTVPWDTIIGIEGKRIIVRDPQ